MVSKIAILGGGAGSLAAAYALTAKADWREKYEITVYQQGWRLGGKGASSRREGSRWRNEEHGLHILGGFYHNAFKLLRACYVEWAQIDPAKARDFGTTFNAQSSCTLEEFQDGAWRHVDLHFPTDHRDPGDNPSELNGPTTLRQILRFVIARVQVVLGRPVDDLSRPQDALNPGLVALSNALDLVLKTFPPDNAPQDSFAGLLAEHVLESALAFACGLLVPAAVAFRPEGRAPNELMLGAIAAICARGVVADRLFHHGFDSINHLELNDWLRKHGATDEVLDSPYVRAGFDYAFAYAGGITQPARPSMAAGVALRAFARLVFTYHGALFFHMEGGMGEAVFTPLYEVLRHRGVKFRFFHRVEALRLNAAGDRIAAIEGRLQTLEPGDTDDYEPLVEHQGRLVWPSQPRFDKLACGDTLATDGDDLECHWAPDRGRPKFQLVADDHFDQMVLGISVGALPKICADLVARNDRWRRMIETARTIPVAGVQIWSRIDTWTLGWREAGRRGLVTGYAQPFATWSDMSFLLGREDPGMTHLTYLCAPIPYVVPADDTPGSTYPADQHQAVEGLLQVWAGQALGYLLPGAVAGGGVRPDFLAETFIRANVSPSDHYVLSPPGSIAARLAPGGSQFANLFLAGDWTKNGVDCGAFEAAVMSGLQCARAITGSTDPIYGEADLP